MANLKVVDTEQLEADLTSVADKIRAKTGSEDALAFPSGFVSAVNSIESGGGADEVLAEVEAMMTKGDSGNDYVNYSYMFYLKTSITEVPNEILRHTASGTLFNHMFYACKKLSAISLFDTSNGANFGNMFYGCESLSAIPTFDFSKGTIFERLFEGCSSLIEIPELNTPIATSFSNAFKNCTNLVTISKINVSNAEYQGGMFDKCTALKNITFDGVIKASYMNFSSCTKLTHDSLMSAINALYDHASAGTSGTFTLTLGSTNLAKLTDAEKAIATQRGWTLA